MDFLNIVIAVHEETEIEIPERDYPKLSTLNDAVSYLAQAHTLAAGAQTPLEHRTTAGTRARDHA